MINIDLRYPMSVFSVCTMYEINGVIPFLAFNSMLIIKQNYIYIYSNFKSGSWLRDCECRFIGWARS